MLHLPESPSTCQLLSKIIVLSFPIMAYSTIFIVIISLLFFFSEKSDKHTTEALSIFTSYQEIFIFSILYHGTVGFEILASRCYGSKRYRLLVDYLYATFILLMIVSSILIVSYFFIPRLIFSMLSFSPETIENLVRLIRTTIAVIPLYSIGCLLIRFTNVIHKNYLAALFQVIGVIFEISCLMITNYWQNLAITGLGLGYDFYVLSNILFIWWIYSSIKEIDLEFNFKTSMAVIKDIILASIFPFLNGNFNNILSYANLYQSLSYGKSDFIAVMINSNLMMFVFYVTGAMINSNSILSAYFVGKKSKQDLFRTCRLTLSLLFGFLSVISFFLFFFRHDIVSAYTSDPKVIEKLTTILDNPFTYINYFLNSLVFFMNQFIIFVGYDLYALSLMIVHKLLFILAVYFLYESFGILVYVYTSFMTMVIIGVAYALFIYFKVDIDNRIEKAHYQMIKAEKEIHIGKELIEENPV